MSARENILARIRAQQGKGEQPDAGEREAVAAYIRARPAGPRPRVDGDLIARFRERAEALASTTDTVEALDAVPAAVARYLRSNTLPLAAVCWRELAGLEWKAAGIEVEAREARETDLVGITGAYCAIAETGTLVTLTGPATPAAVSLLPETHVAVVRASRIVRGMEEAWQLVRSEGEAPGSTGAALPRAVNFISGPSRTADIEQTVTLGAHGPYRVHLVLVAG
ncbi:MAG: lactate utilization protein C [Betaproteobacteria bacterium]|nr:lactate utilization protein C [Betaproteobacteria bacterium]